MNKAKILLILAIATIAWSVIIQTDALKDIFTSADTTMSGQSLSHHEYYFQMHGVETVDNPSVETTYPERAQPDDTQSITDLSHWLDILPYEQDMNRYGYVVYPEHGIVTPFDTPSADDTQKIKNGKKFDHYPYLDNGALHYRGKDPTQWTAWNMVIAAHSSYLKDKPWRYKTVFQALPISSTGDKIFVYMKNENNTIYNTETQKIEESYDLYIYEIQKSFRTDMRDISVLSQDTNEQMLTTYGCYIIWSNSERRINQAILIDTISDISPISPKTPKTLTQPHAINEKDTQNEKTNSHNYKETVDMPTVDAPEKIPTSALKETYEAQNTKEGDNTHMVAEPSVNISGENTTPRKAPVIPLDPTLLPQIDSLVVAIEQQIEANPAKYGGSFIHDRLEAKRQQYRTDSSKAAGFKVALIEAIQERM